MSVFDIEVLNWVKPIAVGFFDGKDYHEFIMENEEDDVVWRFLLFLGQYEGTRIFAHNAANFDNKFILDSLHKHGQGVRFAAGMGKLVWIQKDISFEDSYLMMGRGLAKLCNIFDVDRKLDWDHNSTKNPWEMKSQLDSFRSYLKRDCLTLAQVLDSFARRFIDAFGIIPSSTLSLTAVKAFDKKFCPVKQIESNEKFEKYIRSATYGGRNEVYKRYGENLHLYDVRSMYTSCYDTDVPFGPMTWIKPNLDKGTIAEAKVKVPNALLIGPLPHRYNERLIFPTGEFQGWWDTRELKNATKLGVDVSIIRQLECEEAPLLSKFGSYVGELRQNERESPLWKLFGVRLSGKFGQRRWRTEIKHISEVNDPTGWYPLDRGEEYHERVVYVSGNKSPYVKPAINMRIRSEARIRHLDILLGAEDVYYCDNDSVNTTSELSLGNLPGDLQLVDEAVRAYFIRCKLYGYETLAGTFVQRSSGFRDFRLTEGDFIELLNGKELTCHFTSPGDWKTILRGKGVQLLDKHRSVKGYLDFENRISEGLVTRPIEIPKDLKGDIK